MTQTDDSQVEDLPTLEESEATGGGDPTAGASTMMPVMVSGGGLPAPAYHPLADREYYRFLFAGIVMLIGCLMPFGPAWDMAGYKTMRGGVVLVIALGLVWSSWAAISNRRMVKGLLRWVMLAAIPLVLGITDLIYAFDDGTSVAAWIRRVGPDRSIENWGEFFGELGNVLQPSDQVGSFFRHFGTGRVFVFVGALLAELFMVLAVFGGAKKIKEQQAERRAATTTRRRR